MADLMVERAKDLLEALEAREQAFREHGDHPDLYREDVQFRVMVRDLCKQIVAENAADVMHRALNEDERRGWVEPEVVREGVGFRPNPDSFIGASPSEHVVTGEARDMESVEAAACRHLTKALAEAIAAVEGCEVRMQNERQRQEFVRGARKHLVTAAATLKL